MSLHGYSDAIEAYREALEDFTVILEHVANHDPLAQDAYLDAADVLFEAAYDANLGVWPSDA